jgi:radical SAM protein with 4Fe4S-binding SPASM domain
MTEREFERICSESAGRAKFIYLHVMGQPLLHPKLDELLSIAGKYGLKVCITTNGTLVKETMKTLLSHSGALHKISVSLHAPEGNGMTDSLEEYLEPITRLAKEAAELGIYTVFRLWNEDSEVAVGSSSANGRITEILKRSFPLRWQTKGRGLRLAENIFLEHDGVFLWPKETYGDDHAQRDEGFCYGLMRQVAILADGTVVPCCLDCDGNIPLGNIFSDSLDKILSSERALAIRRGFSSGRLMEPLCRTCTYARRFNK